MIGKVDYGSSQFQKVEMLGEQRISEILEGLTTCFFNGKRIDSSRIMIEGKILFGIIPNITINEINSELHKLDALSRRLLFTYRLIESGMNVEIVCTIVPNPGKTTPSQYLLG